jgi:hypothetical protein
MRYGLNVLSLKQNFKNIEIEQNDFFTFFFWKLSFKFIFFKSILSCSNLQIFLYFSLIGVFVTK